jgi:myo-inositol-1(or 4)-monophosphatase
LGSAAADLAYVACGRFDAFWEYDLKPWDVAAGALLVKEAGGMVSDYSGGRNYLFGREIVA